MSTEAIEKFNQTHEERIVILEFLDWLERHKHMTICKEDFKQGFPTYVKPQINLDTLIDEYFEIDSSTLDEERQAIWDGIDQSIKEREAEEKRRAKERAKRKFAKSLSQRSNGYLTVKRK